MVAGLLSPLPRSIWAKSSRDGAQGESLTAHTNHVVSQLARLAARAPGLTAVAGTDRLWHRAFWSCWLHDLGKGASGFQRMLKGETTAWGHRHEVLSLAFLPWVAAPDSDDFAWIAAGIVSHHKDASVIKEIHDIGSSVEQDTLEGLDAIVGELDDPTVEALIRFVTETAPAWLAASSLRELGVEAPSCTLPDRREFRAEAAGWILAALRAYQHLHRRLADGRGNLAERRQSILLRGLVQLADHLGSAHAPPFAPLVIPAPSDILRQVGVNEDQDLRAHQSGARERIGSLVLAAPTGSGKTEAALLWTGTQLQEPERSRRLVYLLPYEASLNAMYRRLKDALHTDVGLVHGRASQAIYRMLVDEEYRPRVAAAKAFAANNLSRMHHPSVWVGTPYQLVRGAYRLRGYEQVWTALAGSQIVVDEPHAYDPERLGLVLGMLAELTRNWDVRVCAMTATLPCWTRVLLEQAVGAGSLEVDPELFAQYRRHRLQLVHGDLLDDTTLKEIAGQVNNGVAVLVGANTVDRAQKAYDTLKTLLGEERTHLLHSRFVARDRLAKEQEIARLLGVGIERQAGDGLVVVATQVIEVSLNLDFDTIFSEPAPLEALAQRFGRVNRRGKKGIVPVHVLDQPRDGQVIYSDELVERTLSWLAAMDGEVVDEAGLGAALDSIYGEDLAHEFSTRTESARRDFDAACIRDLHAFASDEALADKFDELFDGTEVLPSCFVAEYRNLRETAPLEAHGLLVPISDKRRSALKRRKLARRDPELKQWIVDVPYDETRGLLLPGRSPSP